MFTLCIGCGCKQYTVGKIQYTTKFLAYDLIACNISVDKIVIIKCIFLIDAYCSSQSLCRTKRCHCLRASSAIRCSVSIYRITSIACSWTSDGQPRAVFAHSQGFSEHAAIVRILCQWAWLSYEGLCYHLFKHPRSVLSRLCIGCNMAFSCIDSCKSSCLVDYNHLAEG